jgi:magnesium-transporting ATPase (P-type)
MSPQEVRCDPPQVRDALVDLARAAVRCSSGRVVEEGGSWVARGDPMEAALDALARRVGVDEAGDTRVHPEVARFPFDACRRRMSVVVGDRLVVKGAPDAIFPCCTVPAGATEALQALARRACGSWPSRPQTSVTDRYPTRRTPRSAT